MVSGNVNAGVRKLWLKFNKKNSVVFRKKAFRLRADLLSYQIM